MVFWRERGCWKEEAEDVDVLDGVCNMTDMTCEAEARRSR